MPAAASQALWRDCTVADPLLQIRDLTKRFGGVLASDGISLDVPAGELHAIIGPNGAGKSTLIGQLAGEISPDGGRIFFNGRDITRLPTHHRSALGLARPYSTTSPWPSRPMLAIRSASGGRHAARRNCASRRAPRLLASGLRAGPMSCAQISAMANIGNSK